MLVVSPRWRDASAPDTLRVRSMLPFLDRNGWRATIVASAGSANGRRAESGDVSWVDPLPLKVTRRFGIGSDGIRSYRAVHRRVGELISAERFDVAFFSTTAFELWRLGPYCRERGVPYVLDWQDPWYDPDPPASIRSAPPGGRLKFAVAQMVARRSEPRVARNAAAHVAVSAAYLDALRRRYALPPGVPQTVEPFAVDLEALRRAQDAGAGEHRSDIRRWTCVGRLGNAFHASLEFFFSAIAESRSRIPSDLRIEFVGTGYGDDPLEAVAPIARRYGLAELVDESPRRVPPDDALQLLARAERVLVFASDDDRYVPSRLTNALGIGRPVIFVGDTVPEVWRDAARGLDGVSCLDGAARHGDRVAELFREPEPGFRDRGDFLAWHSAEAMTSRLLSVLESVAAPDAKRRPA